MIQKLQRRFIFITMASISLIFLLILLVLNLSVSHSAQMQGYGILDQYEEQTHNQPQKHPDSGKPFPKNPETPPEAERNMNWFNHMRISYIFFDAEGNILDSYTGNPEMTLEMLSDMADKSLENPKERGRQAEYLYLLRKDDTMTRIYFLDYAPEKNMSMQLYKNCFWIGLLGIAVILIPVILLSRWVTKPVKLSFEKQKQFIADASHELKTPLTIITTNAEVLQPSLPGNKWLNHILEQTGRMKDLINNLLELARLDDYSVKQEFLTFDMSRAVKNAALSFESLAYEYQKTYQIEISPSLTLHGNETSIRQLVTILLDNAFKYSDEHGTILIRLSSHGEKKELLVHNTGNGIPVKEQQHIFERFYRNDTSRSRKSGGYGLGLSIAEAIVKTHKGHIRVKSDGKTYTDFIVSLF